MNASFLSDGRYLTSFTGPSMRRSSIGTPGESRLGLMGEARTVSAKKGRDGVGVKAVVISVGALEGVCHYDSGVCRVIDVEIRGVPAVNGSM